MRFWSLQVVVDGSESDYEPHVACGWHTEDGTLDDLKKLFVQAIQTISDIEESEQQCTWNRTARVDDSDETRMLRLIFRNCLASKVQMC